MKYRELINYLKEEPYPVDGTTNLMHDYQHSAVS